MKERPIIFSGPMVRAILEGRKTVTRRIVRPQPIGDRVYRDLGGRWWDSWEVWRDGEPDHDEECELRPPCTPGDRLWVREGWGLPPQYDPARHGDLHTPPRIGPVCYRAQYSSGPAWDGGRWRSPIHMPRWAARLFLSVVSVRAELLHKITDEDARAEGIPQTAGEAEAAGLFDLAAAPGYEWDNRTSRENFALGWDRLNAKRAPWDSNPYVWRIDFRQETTP